MAKTSAMPGFYKLDRQKRLAAVSDFASLSAEQRKVLEANNPLDFQIADRMTENAIAFHCLPFSVATNFIVNKKEMLIPMAIEEPSVVAAASYAAKLCRDTGGFVATADKPIMTGQIQIVGLEDANQAAKELNLKKEQILKQAEPFAANIASYGGGLRGFEARAIHTKRGKMVVAHLHVDVKDSMGANTVNTILEGISPFIEKICNAKARLRIITNLATMRLAKATAVWKGETIGKDAVEGILDAWAFADADKFRACTHNKGAMNGIDAICVATGNDWRAVEAGAHAYAAIKGKYGSLTTYKKLDNGDLQGQIELPLAVATIGGATKSLASAQAALSILNVKSAQELACVIASVGLAQNFAAVRALSAEGIQKGHMALHARNIAIAAGAKAKQVDKVAAKMAQEKQISIKRAQEILKQMQG